MTGRVAAIALGCFLLAASLPAQQKKPAADAIGGLTFSPVIYRLAAKAGTGGSLQFSMASREGSTVQASMQIKPVLMTDWTYQPKYDVPHSRDCTGWFKQTEATLQVRGIKPVNQGFPYRVPLGAHGSYWAMMLFKPRPAGSTEAVDLQYEVPILFIVGDPEPPLLKVGTPEVQGAAKHPQIALAFVNEGNGFAIVAATCRVINLTTGKLVARLGFKDKNLLPHSKRKLLMASPPLHPGPYRATVNAEIGSHRLPAVVADFDVVGGQIKGPGAGRLLPLNAVAVTPSGVNIFIAPGGTNLQLIKIQNGTSGPLEIEIKPTNVVQSSGGAIGVGNGAPPDSLSFVITPAELTLSPRGNATVRLQVRADRAARGDLWFGLIFKDRGATAGIPQQLLGAVSLKKTLQPKLELVAGKFEYNKQGNPLLLAYAIRNIGNSGIQPTSVAGVIDSSGKLLNTLEVPQLADGGIIPGAMLTNSVMLPPYLTPGVYTVQIKTRYSPTGVAELSIPFKVKGSKVAATGRSSK